MNDEFFLEKSVDQSMVIWRPRANSMVPCVLWNHGSKGDNYLFSSELTFIPNIVKTYLGMGMAVCAFSRAGYNGRKGLSLDDELKMCDSKESIDNIMVQRLEKETTEVIDLAKLIYSYDWIDKTQIICSGYSMGGILTLLALSRSDILCAGIVFSPGAIMWRDFKQVRNCIIKAAGQIVKPTIILQAINDYSIEPAARLRKIFKKNKIPYEVIVYPKHGNTHSEAHGFYDSGRSIWKEHVKLFCEKFVS